MRVAYFINQYPAVSHTFIRREIRALEELRVSVTRFALRPGPNLVDDEDKDEEKQTRFILRAGITEFFRCFIKLVMQPLSAISVFRQAIVMGWRSDKGLLRYLAYLAEAAVLADWCRRDGIRHIHAHFSTNSAAIAMFASLICRIPYSFTAHGAEDFEQGTLVDVKLQNAAFVACVCSFGRSQLMNRSQPDQWRKIEVVHCGLDSSLLTAEVHEIPFTHRFVCVGRLAQEKGHLVLISAVKILRDAGTLCEIVLAGDGPMRKSIEEAIERAELQAAITITGWIPGKRVKAEIEAARALVLPSFSEGMPVVIMEAMALNRPVISTYVAGIPELVQSGKTGWLVPAGDDVALAQAMHEALAAPISQLAQMAAAGRHHVYDQHSVIKEAEKLKKLIERSLSRS